MTKHARNAVDAVEDGNFRRSGIDSRNKTDMIDIRVRDGEAGQSDNVHAALFDPLFTTRRQGAGRGLPICKAVVGAHGGRLWTAAPSRIWSILRSDPARGGRL